MKRLVLFLFLLLLLIPVSEKATAEVPEASDGSRIAAPSIDPEASCNVCHEDVVHTRERLAADDGHEGLDCVECHLGRPFNPHVPSELDADTLELAEAFRGYGERSPEVIAGCLNCHEDEVAAWRDSIHGAGPTTDDGVDRPGCADCHGSLHAVTPASQGKRAVATRCVACHEFAEEENGPASPHVADTYRETIHGKMLALGNDEAAGCSDCHTGHDIHASDDPRSSVHEDNRAETCRRCHEAATESFTAAISHRPHTIDANFWAWGTALAFSTLTVGTILLLFIHVILDLLFAGRTMLQGGVELADPASDAPVAADDEVERFDGHIRLQHVMMIVSFVTLVVTGWPLKSASVGVSSQLAQALGGAATLAFVHRCAGSLLLVVAVYHLVYLALRWRRGQLTTSMIPGPKDASDLVGNLLYYLGARETRPKFGTFTYYEKFDYWAIFWGVPIMVGTGLILWFPEWTAWVLPGDLITLAFIAHSDEALLAALAIFLWHFYNQHLRPSVFPMSWVWLTGRIKAEALYDEHRLEYERRYGESAPRAPAHPAMWHEHPVWSFAALGAVVLAAGAVLTLDIASVRAEIAALEAHAAPIELLVGEPQAPEIVGAFDEGFEPWKTCFACHNEKRYESDEEHFPHKLHFEDEELDDDCVNCHESVFHDKFDTELEDCLECHEADEVGLAEVELN